jgi:D-alanyl-D-alanine carboxypeptidase (penicillin-binding protein 5/6)
VTARARLKRLAAAAGCSVAAYAVAGSPALAITPPSLQVHTATLTAEGTGQQLFGIQPNTEVAIASTTKLMTALITLQHASMNEMFTYPDYPLAADDSQIGLATGERMSVHDLMVAMMLPSADDAAYDLAYNVAHGNISNFVTMMNAEARKLGLAHTHYATPVGLDTPGNYSTANDLVKLATYDIEHYRVFAQIVGMPNAVLYTGNHVRDVTNLNYLVGEYPWIHGVKTGHTLDAGYCLVASGTQNGMTLVSAVMGTSSEAARDANSLALLQWGFANYRQATPVVGDTVLARPTVAYRSGVRADVIAARTFTYVLPRADHLRVQIKVPHQLSGPLKLHAVVGSATILDGGKVVGRMSLLLARALPAVSPITIATQFVMRPSILFLLVVLLGGTAVAVRRRGQRRPRPRTA